MMVTTDPGLMKYLTSVLQQMSGGEFGQPRFMPLWTDMHYKDKDLGDSLQA